MAFERTISMNVSNRPPRQQKRVGAMASFPPRADCLRQAIASVLPQVDELILYLNGYEEVPRCALRTKIRVVRSQDTCGDLRDNGKFYDLPQNQDAYVFTFDDDLIYPPDYVTRMIQHIEMLDRCCVVGVHGVIFPAGRFDRLKQRTVYHFGKKHKGHFVDLLGTGTTAWHSSTVSMSLDQFKTKGVCDMWFAVAAAKQQVPLFAVPRERKWIGESKIASPTLYDEARQHPTAYFDVYESAVAPAIAGGLLRKRAELELALAFDRETLAAAGIELLSVAPSTAGVDDGAPAYTT